MLKALLSRAIDDLRWYLWASRNRLAADTIAEVVSQRLSYLDRWALRDLACAVRAIEDRCVAGAIVEAGCALGGSAITMAAAKHPARKLMVFDAFGMIPAPGPSDGTDVHRRYNEIVSGRSRGLGGDVYYGYVDNLEERVTAAFNRLNLPLVQNNGFLVKGLFQDTIDVHEAIALIHIDCDWFESVMTVLSRLEPQVVPGGRLVIDDYDAWSGCRTAVTQYFASQDASRYEWVRQRRLHIIKH